MKTGSSFLETRGKGRGRRKKGKTENSDGGGTRSKGRREKRRRKRIRNIVLLYKCQNTVFFSFLMFLYNKIKDISKTTLKTVLIKLIKHKLKTGKMYASPIIVVHYYKNANLKTQPKRKYWQEDTSISRCFKNKTTWDNDLY